MRKVIIHGGSEDLLCFVSTDADLDGIFEVTESDTGARFMVHGWNVTIEDYEEGA